MDEANNTPTTPPGITTCDEYALIWAFRRLTAEEQAYWLARAEAAVATSRRGATA